MNLGKFQKKFKESFEGAKSIGQLYDAGLEIIEELERALDTKNEGRRWIVGGCGVNYPELSEEKKNEYEQYELAVKRYKDYGIE